MKQIKSIVFIFLLLGMLGIIRSQANVRAADCREETVFPLYMTKQDQYDEGDVWQRWQFTEASWTAQIHVGVEWEWPWNSSKPGNNQDGFQWGWPNSALAPLGFSGSAVRWDADVHRSRIISTSEHVRWSLKWTNIRVNTPLQEITVPDNESFVGIIYEDGVVKVETELGPHRFHLGDIPLVRYHAPVIQGAEASPKYNNWYPYESVVGTIPSLEVDVLMEDRARVTDFNAELVVEQGWGEGGRYVFDSGNEQALPAPGFYRVVDIDGAPVNDGTQITGIGHTLWRQNVILNSGNVTEFSRNVTVRTTKTPTITLIYDTPELANTPFTDGSHNGGTNGWSNLPLKAVVSTENDDGTHLVDGYYFNQISDDEGNIAHGDARKASASLLYDTNTLCDGTSVTGVMVDDAKTTELSAATEPITVKIDMTNPTAAVSYELATDQLINESYDTLSGIQSTLVALVQPGDPAPSESDYHDFSEWRSLVGNDGEYDIYVIVTDNAGNRASTTLANQFLTGTATDVKITKTVAGKYGSYHKAFEVSIFLEDDQGIAASGEYAVSSSFVDVADYTVTITDGVGIIHIKHDETITLKGLPLGHTMTVKETDAAVTDSNSEYRVTYNGASRENGFSKVLTGSTAIVLIRNTRETIPDMGITENNSMLFLSSTLLLLTVLMVVGRYGDKKRSGK